MKKQGALHGAIILASAGFAVKLMGALFKIPLGAILGPEGNGIFSIAYNIYALLFVIATAGLPVAMSKTVAEAEALGQNSKRILKKALVPFGIAGAILSAIMFFGAAYIGRLIGAESAKGAIRVISPAIFFVSVSAILRGYFQGLGNMRPTAASEIIEAASKLIFGIAAAFFLLICGCNYEILASGATLGVSIGAFISMCYLLYKGKGASSENTQLDDGRVVGRLIKTAVPITLGATVVSLTNVIDSGLVMNILTRLGVSHNEALWQFGAYNYATTVFNLPGFLVSTLGISIVPTVTGACILGKYKEMSSLCETSLKLLFAVAVVAAGGMFVLSEPCLNFLYGGVDSAAIKVSAIHLSILAFAIPPLSLSTLCASLLQAMGDVKKPMYAMAFGAGVKVLFNVLLVRIPQINIYGASFATIACYLVTCGMNVFFLWRKREISISFSRILLLPTLSAILPTLCAKFTFFTLSPIMGYKLTIVPAVLFSVLLWVACIMLFGVVKKGDVKLLFAQKQSPFFEKITKK